MLLSRIDISGFRGIGRLSLSTGLLTTFIGENTWGKSSLLDALSIALPIERTLHSFTIEDFHVDRSTALPQSQHLDIILCLEESYPGEHRTGRYRKIKPLWQPSPSDKRCILYRVCADRHDGKISSRFEFLDINGDVLTLHHSEKLAQELMGLHPVIRLRDARRFKREFNSNGQTSRIEKRIENTCRRLANQPGHVSKGELKSSFNSMRDLIDHYFAFTQTHRKSGPLKRDGMHYSENPVGPSSLKQVANNKNKQIRLQLMAVLNTFLQAKGPNELRRCARPILIIEDPESRLHPTHLSRAWGLLQLLPMQKLLTTNSAVLLAAVPLSSINRLVRKSDKTVATTLPKKCLSDDELRRVGFHIRFHRSSALFARCWLLVEGETEVWLFNELAKLCGYDLAAEGVQIIEFAQSGLKSLIKVAKAYDIDWHVVTDGDAAGKKYAATVLHQLDGEQPRHRLTELPDKDIEHYMYNHGFETFFRDLIKVPYDHPIPAKKVIVRVLKKFAKPDLALAIVRHCEQQGSEAIPVLLRWTLKRVISMANGNT
jgi:putative ATP-dependent endonuclease of OLD family